MGLARRRHRATEKVIQTFNIAYGNLVLEMDFLDISERSRPLILENAERIRGGALKRWRRVRRRALNPNGILKIPRGSGDVEGEDPAGRDLVDSRSEIKVLK